MSNIDVTIEDAQPISVEISDAQPINVSLGEAVNIYQGGSSDHTELLNVGVNTHDQIDTALTRLANTSGTNSGDQDLSPYATNTDLSIGLATKANTGHNHVEADITDLGDYATNSALTTGLAAKANTTHDHVITDITGLQTALDTKQDTLVSGTNIKTINGTPVLGAGDIVIAADTDDQTAAEVPFTPTGSIAATDVQAALAEVDSEKANTADIVTDHGVLTGLADDDHPQYHNDTRGDARYLQLSGGDLTGAVRLNTSGAPEQLAVRSTDEDNSAIGFVGQESDKGTVKITHNKSSTSDANASGVSVSLSGTGTAAKGIYIDAPDGGTTGNLIQARNNGADKFVVDKDGVLTKNAYIKSTGLNNDVLRVDASDGSRLARLVETGGGHGWFEVDNSTGVAQALFRADGGDNYLLTGNFGLGISGPTAKLDINGDILRLRSSKTPATATATGNAGDIAWDSNYIYVCVATNTWKRTALSSW